VAVVGEVTREQRDAQGRKRAIDLDAADERGGALQRTGKGMEAEAELEVEAEAEVTVEAKVEAKAEAEAEAEEAEAEVKVETKAKAKAEAKAEVEVKTKAEAEAEAEVKADGVEASGAAAPLLPQLRLVPASPAPPLSLAEKAARLRRELALSPSLPLPKLATDAATQLGLDADPGLATAPLNVRIDACYQALFE